ncbi:MAG: hypothetical protein ACYC6M_04950 [Terriglobales bacterium]
MGFYTYIAGLGVANLATTFTHSLGAGFPGGGLSTLSIVVRPIIHQPLVTNTAPLIVCTINTNIVTIASGIGTLVTFDLEAQVIFSENL